MPFGFDDALAGIFGGALDYAANENLQDQAQGFADYQGALQRDFNSAEALKQRTWQEHMSNTAVRRNVRDMQKAGINPLLSVHPGGGATTPSGATASSGIANGASASSHTNFAANMATAAQVDLLKAEAEKTRAEAKEVIERTPTHEWNRREIEARIPVHEEQVNNLRQQINHSLADVQRIHQDIRHSESSAANLDQQTKNLVATLPLIRAQVQNLQALTAKNSAETDEIKQRIKENLPQLQRTLGNLEALEKRMAQAGHANAERAADSFLGQLGAYLKHVTPLIPGIGVFLGGGKGK